MKDSFKKAGISFYFCRDAVVPEIPDVQDVLYALKRSDEQRYYDFCANNHSTYIVNVALVIAAVGGDVLCMEPRYDETEARKIIAQAILDLCPPEARCFFVSAFVKAQEEMVGMEAPSRSADRLELLEACKEAGCFSCREALKREYSGQLVR